MTSPSVSRYAGFCRSFFASVERRPLMYFSRLADLETIMHGHGLAFIQLGVVDDRSATFNHRFGEWLMTTGASSSAAGWAVAVESLANARAVDPIGLFFELLDEFMDSWGQLDQHDHTP